jgi:hypothetical protein
MVSDKMTVERLDAVSGNKAERLKGDGLVGAWAPGRSGNQPGDTVKRECELLTFEEEKRCAEMCTIDIPNEDSKVLKVGLDSREDVKGVLRKTKVFSERSTEMVRERGGPRNEVKRDAAEERTRMRSLSDSGGSERDGAEAMGRELGSE